jgi:uncharacterized repeat protein (TIGR01451 family)
VDAGVIDDTATATGELLGGNLVTSPPVTSGPSSTSTPIASSSGISIVKSAMVDDVNGDGKTDLGDTISWSYLVTNTGTVTLTSVFVTDPEAGATTCPLTTLAPGASETCAANAVHPITQADVDAGVVNNTAAASGSPPVGSAIISAPSSTSTPVFQSSSITIVKSASVDDVNGDGKTDLGDTISWSYLVTDTGTITLTSVTVNDPEAGATTCPQTTLAPGASETCTADAVHPITQADVDAGVVDNTATASGTPLAGPPITSLPSSTSTPVFQSSSITIGKSASVDDVNHDGKTDLGDTIAWSYLVTNTGTVTLGSVTVTDPTAGATTCPDPTLAPGASETCAADDPHTITQADVDAGVVDNTATASGTPPTGTPITSLPSSTATPVVQASGITIAKSAKVDDVNHDGRADAGDTIAWSYLVTNTGTVTLTSVKVIDPSGGATACPVSTLAPAASETCTADATYTITQADVTAGSVTDTATATGMLPSGSIVTSKPSSATVTLSEPAAADVANTATPAPLEAVLAFTGMESLQGKIEGGLILIGAGLVLMAASQLRRRTRRVVR